MDNILAVILAGGRGDRLSLLAEQRSKPTVPFAGKSFIIDFTLSNCVNSGINKVSVLTQYQPLSLTEHIGVGMPWGLHTPGRKIQLLQPFLEPKKGRDWYMGTADAVYQNLRHIDESDAELVLILSGDHIYKMDYSLMLEFHQEKQADVTLAFTQFPEEEMEQYGTVKVDQSGQVIDFKEKSKRPLSNLVSMGVYLFRKAVLQQWLEEDAQSTASKHDFGRNLFPLMLGEYKIFGYEFQGYWRDVGTVQAYWQANMDMIDMSPSGYLSDPAWPINTREVVKPATVILNTANVVNSLISSGCTIEGSVEHSVLSPGVIISEGAVVKDSIILADSSVGSHSVVDYSIIDEDVVVGAGCHVGFGDDFQFNRRQPKVLNTGITIVGKRAQIPQEINIGRNCLISPGVTADDFPTPEIQSGETIRSKRKRRGA